MVRLSLAVASVAICAKRKTNRALGAPFPWAPGGAASHAWFSLPETAPSRRARYQKMTCLSSFSSTGSRPFIFPVFCFAQRPVAPPRHLALASTALPVATCLSKPSLLVVALLTALAFNDQSGAANWDAACGWSRFSSTHDPDRWRT